MLAVNDERISNQELTLDTLRSKEVAAQKANEKIVSKLRVTEASQTTKIVNLKAELKQLKVQEKELTKKLKDAQKVNTKGKLNKSSRKMLKKVMEENCGAQVTIRSLRKQYAD